MPIPKTLRARLMLTNGFLVGFVETSVITIIPFVLMNTCDLLTGKAGLVVGYKDTIQCHTAAVQCPHEWRSRSRWYIHALGQEGTYTH